ncbi:MAG: carboxypeptidase regulatory-like domain-containing protein [Micromonosporaceae bacterium]
MSRSTAARGFLSRSPARRLALATVTLLTATLALSSTAFADPATGGVSGHLTDGATPVTDTPVTIYDLNFNFVASTLTDGSGAFGFTDLPVGSYKVSFQLPAFVTQFYHQRLDFDSATVIAVTAGADTAIEEQVVPHGSVAGTVTNPDGSPHAFSHVSAQREDGLVFANTNTGADGTYALPFLPEGNYRVSFSLGDSGPTQYAHQKTRFEDADLIPVQDGVATTLDETLLPVGAISGHVTRDGEPVPSGSVQLINDTGLSGFTPIDPDGFYRIVAFPGTYKLQYQLDNGLIQYAHQKRDEASADTFVVTAGPDLIVDEEAIPTGRIVGHLTDDAGNPVPGANVHAENTTDSFSGFTDESGAFQVEVLPGTYRVAFTADTGTQWAHGQSSSGTADLFTVAAAESVVVDEALRPPGSVSVTARDATTGQVITSFCADVVGTVCTSDGMATFPAVLSGRYQVRLVADDPAFLVAFVNGVIVHSGESTSVTVNVTRAATITTTLRDARTGDPVPNACVDAVPPTLPFTLGAGRAACADETGVVSLTQLSPGGYNLFVFAHDGVHGNQWVGPSGGTGAQENARLVTVSAGATVTVPAIRLDGAGTITGVITDAATGAPLAFAAAGLASSDEGSAAQVFTDSAGRYTWSGLGPYAWTFSFGQFGYAAQFSGGTPNRFNATGIKVKVGQTTTYNVALQRGVTVLATVVGPHGEPVDFARISVDNADSGDQMMASGDCQGIQLCVMQVLGPQPIKLRYVGIVRGEQYVGFLGGDDFEHATVVHVPGTGTKQVTVTLTRLEP